MQQLRIDEVTNKLANLIIQLRFVKIEEFDTYHIRSNGIDGYLLESARFGKYSIKRKLLEDYKIYELDITDHKTNITYTFDANMILTSKETITWQEVEDYMTNYIKITYAQYLKLDEELA